MISSDLKAGRYQQSPIDKLIQDNDLGNIALQISLLGANELSEPVLTGEFSEADQKTYLESYRTHNGN